MRNKQNAQEITVALAGNPNVGKSTVFNALTGMHQHTGNWTGKTVGSACGSCGFEGERFKLVDLPGTYSLLSHSAEEEVARDFLCFSEYRAAIVVCDATCLARNLNLVLQVLEICPRIVICVNLLDEAKRKGIRIDLSLLSKRLGVPVVGCVARKKRTLRAVLSAVRNVIRSSGSGLRISYPQPLEEAARLAEEACKQKGADARTARFFALKLLEGERGLCERITARLGIMDALGEELLSSARKMLSDREIGKEDVQDMMVESIAKKATEIADEVVSQEKAERAGIGKGIDRILTGKYTAYPLMLLFLAGIFYLTIVGANYPVAWLSRLFELGGACLEAGLAALHAPPWLCGILLEGIYRTVSCVVAVMLPPMAIFFPLFTLLEDVGLLPRIAYNLDRPFCRCRACGKQALTMCMGFGCNAAGVTGCRIIDSPRERLLAVLTNAFVPCNGRFSMMLTVLTVFFVGGGTGVLGSLYAALGLTALVLIGVGFTFVATRLLSATLLAGTPSAFTLEIPPYRVPQIGKILLRSLLDRTLFVLGRAVAVAAPAGAVLYLLGHVTVGEVSLLLRLSAVLEPIGSLLGLDGAILLGFILGFPASEIVLPIVMMAYGAMGTLPQGLGALEIGEVLRANGWTQITAVSFLLFSLLHWPCSTTVLTVKKETGRWGYAVLSALLPTLFGVLLCLLLHGACLLFEGILAMA